MPKRTAAQRQEQQEAIENLRAIIKPGDTVYTICSHVSSSGMMRVIDLVIPLIDDNGRPYISRITWLACKAIGMKYNRRHDGMEMSGCGMDMGFHAVYCLGQAIWPDGTPEPHSTRNGQPDTVGGYAIKHQWI
jgi:hypothetical protein